MVNDRQHDQCYLKLTGVRKEYETEDKTKQPKVVLDLLDLEIRQGEFVVIVGKNGCGKTTLMKMLGLVDPDYEGEYHIENSLVLGRKNRGQSDGRDDLSHAQQEEFRRKRFGFIFQDSRLLPFLNAQQNVELPLMLQRIPREDRRGFMQDALNAVRFPKDRLSSRIQRLSGGEKQRLAIARALTANPDILIADEPVGALDPDTRPEVLRIFRKLSRERRTTVIMTTHHPREAKNYADRVLELRDGRLQAVEYEQEMENHMDGQENLGPTQSGECNIDPQDLSRPSCIPDRLRLAFRDCRRNYANLFALGLTLSLFVALLTSLFALGGGVAKTTDQMAMSFRRLIIHMRRGYELTEKQLKTISYVEHVFPGRTESLFIGRKLFAEATNEEIPESQNYEILLARSLRKNDLLYEDMAPEASNFFSGDSVLEVILTYKAITKLGFADEGNLIGKWIQVSLPGKRVFPLKIVNVVQKSINEHLCDYELVEFYIPDQTLQLFLALVTEDIADLTYDQKSNRLSTSTPEKIILDYDRVHIYSTSVSEVSKLKEKILYLYGYEAIANKKEYDKWEKNKRMIDASIRFSTIGSIVIVLSIILAQMLATTRERATEIVMMKLLGGKNSYIAEVYTINTLIACATIFIGIIGGIILGKLINDHTQMEYFALTYKDWGRQAAKVILIIGLLVPLLTTFVASYSLVARRNLETAFQR